MMDNEHINRNIPIKLEPLTPQYLEEEHEVYVSALLDAIEDENVHNIALSGGYGIGKSSILRQFASLLKGRCIEVSLSTLAPVNGRNPENEAVTGGETTTNKIQREVVKQLLYRESAQKMPLSRFRRIEAFSPEWAWQISFVTGAIITIAFVLTGWAEMLSEKLLEGRIGIPTMTLLVFFGATFIVFAAQSLLNGKLNIKEVAAGPATVSLNEDDGTYFDKYLDEIVYFFEIADYDIIIFEDIDRFEDPTIFESLKELNAILNLSPCISRPIRFIYAVKDSIFDHGELKRRGRRVDSDSGEILDRAKAESVRSNRTKFFDVIVPVVPFITHASARDHLTRMMSEIDHDVDDNLIDLASQHVPDMRMLKNVRNEFLIFRAQIMSHGGHELGLSETQLFAMMLYKSSHLADFEKIRIGQSDLDKIYRMARVLVFKNIERQEQNRAKKFEALSRIDKVEAYCEDLGEKLELYVHRTVNVVYKSYDSEGLTYEFNGERVDSLKDVQFWRSFLAARDDAELVWKTRWDNPLYFSKVAIVEELGESLDVEEWQLTNRKELQKSIDEIQHTIQDLRGASYLYLLEHSDQVFSDVNGGQSFGEYVIDLLQPGLAFDLIESGYITQDYVLYSSVFYPERMSCRAMNYVIHNVESNEMDVQYQLDPEEVKAVLARCGSRALGQSRLYNISILDWLFENDLEGAKIVVSSFNEEGADQMQFLRAYLEGGARPDSLLEVLAKISSKVLDFLIVRLDLNSDLCAKCVNIAISNLGAKRQRVSPEISDYLRMQYSSLSVCVDQCEDSVLDAVVDLFDDTGVKARMLSELSSDLAAKMIQRNLYDITRDNLSYIVGDASEGIELDVIKAVNPVVYDYVLKALGEYLSILTDADLTVKSAGSFMSVLSDLEGSDLSFLESVIDKADVSCEISDLTKVSGELWPVLVLHRRCPSTWRNVTHYVYELGFEAELLVLLNDTRSISDVEDVNDLERNRFAIHILDYCGRVLDVDLAVQLVNSLHLETPLDASSIEHPTGDMLAGLLEGGSIADCPDSYRLLVSSDWQSRKMYILASEKFVTFMTPQLIGGDLPLILADMDIPRDIHEKILEDVELYSHGASGNGLSLIAERACEYEMPVPLSVVRDMVSAHVDVRYVLALLGPLLDDVGCSELRSILNGLGGVYADLMEVGRHVVRIPKICGSEELLERLEDCGIVSSSKDEGSLIKVNLKRTGLS